MLTENGNPNLWSASRSKTRARACASAKIRKKNSARGKNRPRQTCAGARRFKSARRGASVRRAPRRYRLFCAARRAFAQANIGLARGGRPALGRNILANIGGFPRGKIHLPLARPAYRALFPVALLPCRTMLGNISARIAGYAGCCGFCGSPKISGKQANLQARLSRRIARQNPDAKNGGTEGGKHLANSAILRSTQSGRNIFVKR